MGSLKDAAKFFHSEWKLARAKKLLNSIPEGREILSSVKALNVMTVPKALMGGAAADVDKWDQIRIDEDSSIEDMAVSLVHELRHIWQKACATVKPLKFQHGPKAFICFTRIVEGDAHTFGYLIARKIYEKTGKKAKNVPVEVYNLSSPFDWKSTFLAFQKSNRAFLGYDLSMLEPFSKIAWMAAENPGSISNMPEEVSAAFNMAASKTFSMNNLSDMTAMLRAGLSASSPLYIDAKSNEELANTVYNYVSPIVRQMHSVNSRMIQAAKEQCLDADLSGKIALTYHMT